MMDASISTAVRIATKIHDLQGTWFLQQFSDAWRSFDS